MVKVARREGNSSIVHPGCTRRRNCLGRSSSAKSSDTSRAKSQSPGKMIHFKVYKSQLPVIEQALETAGLMLGSDKSRGYMLEMICADFLAGANLENRNPDALVISLHRLFVLLPPLKKKEFIERAQT